MMHATHTYTSQFPMYQSQKVDKDVLYLQNLQGQNISTDNLYTSVELLKWLLTRNITTVTTKPKGKKNVVILSIMRPIDACTKDDDKFKPQIFSFKTLLKVART